MAEYVSLSVALPHFRINTSHLYSLFQTQLIMIFCVDPPKFTDNWQDGL